MCGWPKRMDRVLAEHLTRLEATQLGPKVAGGLFEGGAFYAALFRTPDRRFWQAPAPTRWAWVTAYCDPADVCVDYDAWLRTSTDVAEFSDAVEARHHLHYVLAMPGVAPHTRALLADALTAEVAAALAFDLE